MREARGLWWALAGAAALACGSPEPEPTTTNTRPMSAPEASAAIGNLPPEIRSVQLRPDEPSSGEPVQALVDAVDGEGDPITLGFSWSVNGQVYNESSETLTPVGARKGDTLELRVTASDGYSESNPYLVSTTMGNRAPRLKGVQVEPAGRVTSGGDMTLVPAAEDPDGDAIEFEYTWWVNGIERDETGPRLRTRSLRRGDKVSFEVVATDGEDASEPIRSDEIEIVNAAPAIVSSPEPPDESGVFRYQIEATDPDGDRNLRYQLGAGPEGMSVDRLTGEVVWKPSEEQAGVHPVELVVTDSSGGSGTQSFELTVAGPDAPPASPEP